MTTHLFSYVHGGQEFVFELKADSVTDANMRLASLAATARYDGVLVEKVSVWLAPWTPIEVWVRNLFRGNR